MKPNIAIDGPAGAGKSTVAKMLADRLGLLYIDTGAMYRALTYCALKNSVDINNPDELVELAGETEIYFDMDDRGKLRVYCSGEDVTDEIREPKVSAWVSKAAQYPEVRRRMVEMQRKIASNGGTVMDGRDIGTNVLPDACLKIFITAGLDERVRRRYEEQVEQGYDYDVENLRQDIIERDELDTKRKIAPLKKAEDAVLIDTTDMSIEQVVDLILKLYRERIENGV